MRAAGAEWECRVGFLLLLNNNTAITRWLCWDVRFRRKLLREFLFQAGFLAAQPTQEVQAGLANLAVAFHHHFLDAR
jgi:hypothetical protein